MDSNKINHGEKKISVARKRWKLLARSLIKSKRTDHRFDGGNEVSIRRFRGFNIFNYDKKHEDDDGTWYYVKNRQFIGSEKLMIRLLHSKLDPEVLIGFNNTGNICIWPSEEVLALYCLKNKEKFRGKNVCELGGGMVALAGLLLASEVNTNEILLTDGNKESSSNIQQIMKFNQEFFRTKSVTSRHLLWGQDQDPSNISRFDFIICADCLYFTEFQEKLIETFLSLLRDQGEAILFAPKRGPTFEKFKKLAKKSFDVAVVENYDEEIWQMHLANQKSNSAYNADIHYPLQLILRKKEKLCLEE